MTNEEILEAEKLIAGLRDDLSLIAGSADDAEKLADLVLEKIPNVDASRMQLFRLLNFPRKITLEIYTSTPYQDFVDFGNALMPPMTFAQLMKRETRYAETFVTFVAQEVPRAISALDKIEQYLATLSPEN